jgi:outer membrane receptor protein involved in Fe transport
MVYARLASGWRPGGPNVISAAPLSSTYKPDTTQNYEIGVKGNVLDHALSFDASIYHIDWKDIQLQLRDPVSGSVYFANGSQAKSQGVEFSIESRPLSGLRIAAWVAWNDAVLTKDLPPTANAVGASGSRLPNSSRFSGNLLLDQSLILTSGVTGLIGVSVSYVGSREGIFLPSPQRQSFPAYAKTDLRAGLKFESWAVNFFVNNVTDKRGLLSGGLGNLNPNAFNYIQPRTVGLSAVKSF